MEKSVSVSTGEIREGTAVHASVKVFRINLVLLFDIPKKKISKDPKFNEAAGMLGCSLRPLSSIFNAKEDPWASLRELPSRPESEPRK